ncbi:hypothetical protein PVAG01_08131 [Phlyctema vagabunda]|uniref:Altered inheritance of mitochondria protein 6 n=1 Tax=Phlyctema vagabunda TaxID=108571 RepID=A0ABR4P8K2_9HELO
MDIEAFKAPVPRWRRKSLYSYILIFLAFLISTMIVLGLQIHLLLHILPRVSPDSITSGAHNLSIHIQTSDKSYPRPLIEEHLSSNLKDFTSNLPPIPCHSHNDYERSSPLFAAIAAGCTSVEADIWRDPKNSSNLLVGHKKRRLSSEKNLYDMYINPLRNILDYQNSNILTQTSDEEQNITGIFTESPDTPLILLIDFKSPSDDIWDTLQAHLDHLRNGSSSSRSYLRSWDRNTNVMHAGPLIIVATGRADFDDIMSIDGSIRRDIFYDAPLLDVGLSLTNSPYNKTNSYYASSSLNKALGGYSSLWGSSDRPFTTSQMATLQRQAASASNKGLVSRYWDTPRWPAARRVGIWRSLVEDINVGVLNVDEVAEAARWNWSWCQFWLVNVC